MPVEGRGLSSRQTQDVVRDWRLGNLSTPISVQKPQMALHAKAKAEAGCCFYALYDKISRDDILVHAYAQCRANKGAPGVDGQDFAEVEASEVEQWLGSSAYPFKSHQKSGCGFSPPQGGAMRAPRTAQRRLALPARWH
ncbi:hypothetical protein CS8_050350 [Cupriavidus sp. 8B]